MLTNFPNGASSFGVPMMGGATIPSTTGQYLFVSSVTGSNGNNGFSVDFPKASIQGAVTAANASKGDVIVCLPGHVETITSAGALTINKAGLYIVGVGNRGNRPQITFTTATTADMNIDAASVTINNFLITLTGIDALAAPIDVNAANFALINCNISTGNATNQATLAILGDANATGMWVKNCNFLGTADAGTAAAIRMVGGDYSVIEDCFFHGAYTTSLGAIDQNTTAGVGIEVNRCYINNLTASSTKAMVFAAATTGMLANNRMQILSGTAPITGAAMSWVGANYYAATIATAGTLI